MIYWAIEKAQNTPKALSLRFRGSYLLCEDCLPQMQIRDIPAMPQKIKQNEIHLIYMDSFKLHTILGSNDWELPIK
jgi:hypothetical protein